MENQDLTIVVPCYNEAEALPGMLPDLLRFCGENGFSLVVVDDGSSDGSHGILERFQDPRLRVIRHKVNRGYGAAIKTGVFAATTRYVVTIDADGQHDLQDVLKLFRTALEKDADMVVGERDSSQDASRYRTMGKAIIRLLTAFFLEVKIKDINSGMKLYDRDLAIPFFPFCPDGMSYSDNILLFFLQYRMLVVGVPIAVKPRRTGESVINTMTAVHTLYELLLTVLLFHPFRFFGLLSSCVGALAFIWSVRCFCLSRSISTGSNLLWGLAFVTFFLGFVAEQLCRFRKQQIRTWEYGSRFLQPLEPARRNDREDGLP